MASINKRVTTEPKNFTLKFLMRDIKFLQTKKSKAAQFKLRQIADALDQHIPFFF